ncbi:hypothetical protein [Nocardiopsis aegyptia]|uniref:CRISPR/Cas system-associated protein Csm6 n=1 Tax=Nocardiopsis aegyptia TaxID=220378 RepID=A0A7Z0EIY1_9ACTN|nr:hypothetical protein [Nocardiopsis aegyptia]NYJ32861.1 CRISPR/Cas system-associated protein Csm6 [Nocardiopsis aegyptia]
MSLFDNLQVKQTELRRTIEDSALRTRVARARAEFHDPDRETIDRTEDARHTSEWLRAVTTPDSGQDRKDLEDLLDRVDPRMWPARASAELSTLAAKNPPNHGPELPEHDTAILISSDTDKGLRAALFNAVALAGGDLDRVRYLAEPTDRVRQERGKVVIVRLPGLDTGYPKGFVKAMRGLGSLGRGVDRMLKEDADVAFFHLSGGFKAALPFLLSLGEALRSLRGRSRVRAFALHELSRDLISIELPLRFLSPELLREEISGAAEDGTLPPKPAGKAPLLGFAYDTGEDGLALKLTPFGHALRELLTLKPET